MQNHPHESIPWDYDGQPRIQGPQVDMGAYEGAYLNPTVEVSTKTVNIREGGNATFNVVLGVMPDAPLEVVVSRQYGDPDITIVSGASLVFNSTNYSKPQMVTLVAAEDADYLNGAATIAVTIPGEVSVGVTVVEQDNDPSPDIIYVL